MFKLISRILQSKWFTIFIKVLASLASTIIVINGYFILTNRKTQDDENEEDILKGEGSTIEVEAEELPEDDIEEGELKKGKIHLFKRRK